jgi:UDP-N-acetylmuramoyl-tripeptide--D-alanyl-D-alanine ligase
VAQAVQGRLLGADADFARVIQDTRKLAAHDLFVAIHGEHFDGHDFLVQAERLGAAGALVQRRAEQTLPQVLVADTRQALGTYAAHWRRQFSLPVVGVTGSSGKTTVKEMIASILKQGGETLATRGNLNNDIGMPLTLLELEARHRYAVIEMGTNHPGEIEYLARLSAPTVGLVTNAGPAHLEFLGSIAGVAREKGALFACMDAAGTAVINADDAHAALWREMAGRRRVWTFGLAGADFQPVPGSLKQSVDGNWQFRLRSPAGETDMQLSLPGRHNVGNALAAAAAAMAAGATLAQVREGLAQVPATAGRLVVTGGWNGSRLIDDTYNANPQSLAAAMEFLVSLGGSGWLVLGDMGELGETTAKLHAECGTRARDLGVERLFALGPNSRYAADAFGSRARWFDDLDSLLRALRAELTAGVTVLVKGSRSMRMERVVEALRPQPAAVRAANGE